MKIKHLDAPHTHFVEHLQPTECQRGLGWKRGEKTGIPQLYPNCSECGAGPHREGLREEKNCEKE